jgi:hypothetical protein
VPADREEVIVVPDGDEIVSYEHDIRPLFRAEDQESMSWSFDLFAYDDVKEYATSILDRLREGSMPCDGEWPEEDVDRFQRWIEAGMRE